MPSDAFDAFTDVAAFVFDINNSFADVVASCGDAITKPPRWCRRRAEDEPTYVGEGVWSSVQFERQTGTRVVKRYDWTPNAIRMYRPYRLLEAERKNAKCDDKQRQTLSFLDLPGEIRTQIYKLALLFEVIETEPRVISRAHTSACARQLVSHEHRCPWCFSQYAAWRRTVRPALGLLRLNKQINAEAASVFCGINEFRFSASNGRDTLDTFCKTIGEANTRRLAKVTHHVTFDNRVDRCSCLSSPKVMRRSHVFRGCYQILPVWLCKSNTSDRKISPERWKALPSWLKWRGMHMQGTIQSQDPIDFDFARALTDGKGGLREYKLILPHVLQIRREQTKRYLRCIFDHVVNPHGAASGIKITLVVLDPNLHAMDRMLRKASLALQVEYQLRREFVGLALQWGWEVVMANIVDKETGYYVYSAPLGSLDEYISKVSYEMTRVPHYHFGWR